MLVWHAHVSGKLGGLLSIDAPVPKWQECENWATARYICATAAGKCQMPGIPESENPNATV